MPVAMITSVTTPSATHSPVMQQHLPLARHTGLWARPTVSPNIQRTEQMMCANVEDTAHDWAPIIQAPAIGKHEGEGRQLFHHRDLQHLGRDFKRLITQSMALCHVTVTAVRL